MKKMSFSFCLIKMMKRVKSVAKKVKPEMQGIPRVYQEPFVHDFLLLGVRLFHRLLLTPPSPNLQPLFVYCVIS